MAWCLTWLVQSLALGVVTAAFVRLPGVRTRAAARAAAWTVALAGTAALAVLPFLAWLQPGVADAMPATGAAPATADPALVVLPAVPVRWVLTALAAWAIGAVAWIAYAVREVLRIRRLKRACAPWNPEDHRRLDPSLRRLMAGRPVRLCWCDLLDGPALLGFRRPVVALPRAHGERLSDQELTHVLLHEAAHLRRRDDWAALLELLVAGALWINPVVHVARRSLALAREMACDDWAVRQSAAPVSYARCLTAVAGLRSQRRRSSLAAAATGARSLLARRVTRVLDQDRRPSTRVARLAALLTPVAVGIVAVALIQTPPFVVDRVTTAASSPSMTPSSSGRVVNGGGPVVQPAAALVVPPSRETAGRTAGDRQRRVPGGAVVAGPAVVPESAIVGNRPDAVALPSVDQAAGAERAPLRASAVPGVGMPGVPVADASAAALSSVPSENTPWWGRAARVGAATGEGATTAGRATASFLKRLGSSVSGSLSR